MTVPSYKVEEKKDTKPESSCIRQDTSNGVLSSVSLDPEMSRTKISNLGDPSPILRVLSVKPVFLLPLSDFSQKDPTPSFLFVSTDPQGTTSVGQRVKGPFWWTLRRSGVFPFPTPCRSVYSMMYRHDYLRVDVGLSSSFGGPVIYSVILLPNCLRVSVPLGRVMEPRGFFFPSMSKDFGSPPFRVLLSTK